MSKPETKMKKILLLSLFSLFTSSWVAAQCADGEVAVSFIMYTDAWAYENYWQLVPSGASCGNDVIAEGANLNVGCAGTASDNSPEGYDNDAIITEGPFCLNNNAYYDLIFVDSYGDGGLTIEVYEDGVLTHVYSGTGNGNTWTFQIGVSGIPVYDMPCNAIEVMPNGASVEITNEGAIVGVGEVSPSDGSCSVYGLWCENNLSNTVWAYFIAEADVTYEITTCGDLPGFDTQIALWHAGECSDFSTYELISSNDDMVGGCSTSNGYSSLMYAGCLIPGDAYYIQIDGWQGATGTTTISVNGYEGDVTLQSIEQDVNCPVNKGEEGFGSIYPYLMGAGVNFTCEWTGPNGFMSDANSLQDIVPGAYNLTLTTSCGEVFTNTYDITEPAYWNVFFTATQPSCAESGNGEMVVNVSGATSPYEYSWTGPSNFNSGGSAIANLDAGAYQLVITDDNGCIYNTSYNLPSANDFTLDLGGPVVLCSNQVYTLEPGNGYTYEWYDGTTAPSIQIDATEWGIGDHTIFATATTPDGCSDVDTFEFTVDGCISVEEVGAPLVTNMYPQPSSGLVNFNFKQRLSFGTLRVFDAIGRVVFEVYDIQSNNYQATLDLAAGRYTVQVTDGAQYFVAPLVIER